MPDLPPLRVYDHRRVCEEPDHDGAPRRTAFAPRAFDVPGVTDAVWVAANALRTCVLHASGSIACFGR